jgi:hypothetical protein
MLYQGRAGIVAAGTVPYYGGGLPLFPFSRLSLQSMHVRVGRIPPWKGVLNLPQIFQGSYRDFDLKGFGCLDFVTQQVTIQVLDPPQGFPFQHSGESIGRCDKVQLQVVPPQQHPIRFLTLMPPRLIYEHDNPVVDDDDDDSTK